MSFKLYTEKNQEEKNQNLFDFRSDPDPSSRERTRGSGSGSETLKNRKKQMTSFAEFQKTTEKITEKRRNRQGVRKRKKLKCALKAESQRTINVVFKLSSIDLTENMIKLPQYQTILIYIYVYKTHNGQMPRNCYFY